MSNYNDNKNRYNDASYYYNKSTKSDKVSPVEDDEIQMIGIRPALNKIIRQLSATLFSHKQISNM